MSALTAIDTVLHHASAPAGAVVGVSTDSHRDVASGGFANSANTPITRATAFDLASVTKVVATTTALLRLSSLDVLQFDDDVSRFLPDAPLAAGTTIRDLLQHRGGLWEWQPLYFAAVPPFEVISRLPLRYPPRSERHYSDLGFMLLGNVVSVAADMPLDDAVRVLVTEPLNMHSTGYGPVHTAVAASSMGDQAERHMVETGEPYPILSTRENFPWRDGEVIGVANDGNCFHAFGGVAGHAGLFSTVDDLLTLGSALANPTDHPELWSEAAVTEVLREGPDAGQALGWRSMSVRENGTDQRMLWHPGFTGCALGIIPATRTAVALMSNRLLAATPTSTESLWRAMLPALLSPDTHSFATDTSATAERTTTP